MMLPLIQASFAPHCTAGAGLSAALSLIHSSSVKSVAPTSAGGPGSELVGSSIRILTRSTSPAPVPEKRSEYPNAPPAFSTTTTTGADVVVLPLASRARAVSVWVPFATVVVSQDTEYGANTSSCPTGAPSTKNCTPATPTLSDASATSTMEPRSDASGCGAVIVTAGGVVSTGPAARCVMSSTPSAQPAVNATVTVCAGSDQPVVTRCIEPTVIVRVTGGLTPSVNVMVPAVTV